MPEKYRVKIPACLWTIVYSKGVAEGFFTAFVHLTSKNLAMPRRLAHTIMKRALLLTMAIYYLAMSTSPVRADMVFQTDSDGLMSRFDTTTGVTAQIGSTTVGTMDGLAFSPNGVLYGIRDNLQTQNARLYMLDANTGAATLIGHTGIPLTEGLAFGIDGTLYTMSSGNLYSVNLVNASVNLLKTGLVELDGLTIAPIDVNTTAGMIGKGSIVGVRPTVDNGGTTYIYAIDTLTFTQTLLHTVPLSVVDETAEFGPDGTLYGNNLNRSPGGSGWWAIDLFGNDHELIGISNSRVVGSAIASVAIPENSQLVVWSVMMGIVTVAVSWRRFRQGTISCAQQ